MDTWLWVLQIILSASYLWIGYGHAFRPAMIRRVIGWAQWMDNAPHTFVVFVGTCELLGAAGLILPALTGILTWLTPLAALCLAIMMICAGGLHIIRREYPALIAVIFFLTLDVCVVYGRWIGAPF